MQGYPTNVDMPPPAIWRFPSNLLVTWHFEIPLQKNMPWQKNDGEDSIGQFWAVPAVPLEVPGELRQFRAVPGSSSSSGSSTRSSWETWAVPGSFGSSGQFRQLFRSKFPGNFGSSSSSGHERTGPREDRLHQGRAQGKIDVTGCMGLGGPEEGSPREYRRYWSHRSGRARGRVPEGISTFSGAVKFANVSRNATTQRNRTVSKRI